jgi:hypothetical protein
MCPLVVASVRRMVFWNVLFPAKEARRQKNRLSFLQLKEEAHLD